MAAPTQQRKLSPVRNQNVDLHVSLKGMRRKQRANQKGNSLRDLGEDASDDVSYRSADGCSSSEGGERNRPEVRRWERVGEDTEGGRDGGCGTDTLETSEDVDGDLILWRVGIQGREKVNGEYTHFGRSRIRARRFPCMHIRQ